MSDFEGCEFSRFRRETFQLPRKRIPLNISAITGGSKKARLRIFYDSALRKDEGFLENRRNILFYGDIRILLISTQSDIFFRAFSLWQHPMIWLRNEITEGLYNEDVIPAASFAIVMGKLARNFSKTYRLFLTLRLRPISDRDGNWAIVF